MNKLFITATVFALLGLVACDKDEHNHDDHTDKTAPTINIISPVGTEMMMSGDTVKIQAEVTDNDELHEVSLSVTRTHMGNTEEVMHKHYHSHTDKLTITEDYVIAVPGMHNDFKFIIKATDHNNNLNTDTAHLHVHM